MAFASLVLFDSIAFLSFTLSAHSLPIAIGVSLPTVFVPDPSGRGTIGLVTSCLTTLALCVWTAIHMNISPTKTSSFKRFWVKLSWASLSIIAPEITLLRALMQYETAAALRKERNAIYQEIKQQGFVPRSATSSPNSKTHDSIKWTLEHGFFALMGGFVVSVKEKNQWILDDGRTLTPRGVLELARLNVLPEVNVETVRNRSQSDRLAKAIVILQVSWMFVQTISRAIYRLPITLLELNTLAHISVALALYGLWWKKPQDVKEPIEIQLDAFIACYMSSRSLRTWGAPIRSSSDGNPTADAQFQNTAGKWHRDSVWQQLAPPNQSGLRIHGNIGQVFPWHDNAFIMPDNKDRHEIQKRITPEGLVWLFPGQYLDGLNIHPTAVSPRHLSREDIKRLVLYKKLMRDSSYRPFLDHLKIFVRDARLCHIAAQGKIQGNLQLFSEYRTLWAISLLSLVYGAIHATSWNGYFPSEIEKRAWRIASCVVMGGGIIICLLDYPLRHCTGTFLWPLGKGHHIASRTKVQKFFARILLMMIGLIAVGCTLSRSFFVLEAIMSIRDLPSGAYQTVNWTNLLPHFG